MGNKLDYKKMGERIRKYRLTAHMTQEQLAELCNINPASISRLETNATSCSLSLLVSVAVALNVSLDDLVCDSLPSIKNTYLDQDVQNLLKGCTTKERETLIKLLESAKKILREQK